MLPPLMLADYATWMTRYHETYGVGDLGPVYEAQAEQFRQQRFEQ